jgi:hypothetical protein
MLDEIAQSVYIQSLPYIVVTHGVPWTKGLEVETGCMVAALKQVRAQLAQPRLYRTDLTVHFPFFRLTPLRSHHRIPARYITTKSTTFS